LRTGKEQVAADGEPIRLQFFAEFVRGFWSGQKGFGSQPTTKIWLEQRAAGQGRGDLIAQDLQD
jgi:hypothetical protein